MHTSVFVEVRPPTLMIYKLNDSLLVSPVTDVAVYHRVGSRDGPNISYINGNISRTVHFQDF